MRTIEVDLPKEYFDKDRDNKLMARLAKFDLEIGDTIKFFELDENGIRTGNSYEKRVRNLHRMQKATRFWTKEDLEKYGIYIIDMDLL
jgi:hypothetical protein